MPWKSCGYSSPWSVAKDRSTMLLVGYGLSRRIHSNALTRVWPGGRYQRCDPEVAHGLAAWTLRFAVSAASLRRRAAAATWRPWR